MINKAHLKYLIRYKTWVCYAASLRKDKTITQFVQGDTPKEAYDTWLRVYG